MSPDANGVEPPEIRSEKTDKSDRSLADWFIDAERLPFSALFVGVLAILVFPIFHIEHFWLLSGLALSVSAGSGALGALFGFIFGIPRTSDSSASSKLQRGVGEDGDATRVVHNTNLGEISDWLTKILVGAGLSQLALLPDLLGRVSENVLSSVGEENNGSDIYLIGIGIYCASCGFFLSYILTQLKYSPSLRRAMIEAGDLGNVEAEEIVVGKGGITVGSVLEEEISEEAEDEAEVPEEANDGDGEPPQAR